VIVSFSDDTTRDLFDGANTPAARTIPKALWPVARRKLDAIATAARLQDLRMPPGNRLERLSGDRQSSWSIRVNEKYRVTFRFENGHAHDVCCEDYH
jgi:proteic killer suppression protein